MSVNVKTHIMQFQQVNFSRMILILLKERMSNLAKQSNLRISNLGRLPTPNLEFPDPELFNKSQ